MRGTYFFLFGDQLHFVPQKLISEKTMPEGGRWCGDAREVMTLFWEIDLAVGYITETVAGRSGDLQIKNIMRPSARVPTFNVAPRSLRV